MRQKTLPFILFAGACLLATPACSQVRGGQVQGAADPGGDPYYEPMTQSQRVAQIENIQEALKEKGYDPGPIDGVMGPKTQQAIKNFQQATNLKVTGAVDAETARELDVEKATGTEAAIEHWDAERGKE
jgi:peptidoglycan hydrolase-like protein with peptidoglycan-binding domain